MSLCGKIIYASRSEARQAADDFQKRGKRKSKKSLGNSYYCKDCKGWHLTTVGKKKKKHSRQPVFQSLDKLPVVKIDNSFLRIRDNNRR